MPKLPKIAGIGELRPAQFGFFGNDGISGNPLMLPGA
jgi:hypothetical protein